MAYPSANTPVPLASLIPGIGSQLAAANSFLTTLLLSTVFGTMLYGLSVHQTYRYFQGYPKDIKLLKLLVLTLFILDTVHTAFSIDSSHFYLVTNYLNPLGLEVYHISLKVIAPITGCTTLLCQLFYARRVYIFGAGHKLLLLVAGVFMLAKLGFVVATCIKGFETVHLQTFLSFSRIVSSASFGCDLAADTILTTTLVVDLLRSRTGFKRTDNVIEVLILYTVNTGLATSIVAVMIFIFSLAMPRAFIYGGMSIVSNKVNVNAVMAVLNSRQALSARMGLEMGTSRAEDRGEKPAGHVATTDSWFAPQRRVSVSLAGASAVMAPTRITPSESTHSTTTADVQEEV